jgi:hypothetical protein
MQLKQVKITLEGGEAQIEAGALQYMHGQIQVENFGKRYFAETWYSPCGIRLSALGTELG